MNRTGWVLPLFPVLLALLCVLGGGGEGSCVGPKSPIRSRWRLPVGLGSLNKISVPSLLSYTLFLGLVQALASLE